MCITFPHCLSSTSEVSTVKFLSLISCNRKGMELCNIYTLSFCNIIVQLKQNYTPSGFVEFWTATEVQVVAVPKPCLHAWQHLMRETVTVLYSIDYEILHF